MDKVYIVFGNLKNSSGIQTWPVKVFKSEFGARKFAIKLVNDRIATDLLYKTTDDLDYPDPSYYVQEVECGD